MTPKQARIKYGKKMYEKMNKSRELDGITVALKENGEIDIPERDLERAYDIVVRGESDIAWD